MPFDRFSPDIPGYLQGEITGIVVGAPPNFPPPAVGTHVVDPAKPFDVTVTWTLSGVLVPLWQQALGGAWDVTVYAESQGAGPETKIGNVSVPVVVLQTSYTATIPASATGLSEHDPNSPNSGIYRLSVAVFLNSTLPAPGFDLIGFRGGPLIQVESPH